MAREINLVPDIKNDMIKALKLRNLIFFISIVDVLFKYIAKVFDMVLVADRCHPGKTKIGQF